jgi:hypothetical protein
MTRPHPGWNNQIANVQVLTSAPQFVGTHQTMPPATDNLTHR